MKNKKSINKVVVVTGVTSGLGRAILDFFIKKKYFVYGIYLKNDLEAIQINKKYNEYTNFLLLKCDITCEEQVITIAEKIKLYHNKIDILVNCAGITLDGLVKNYNLNNLDKVYKANLYGKINCIQKFYDLLKKSENGRIINIASRLASKPMKESIAYCSMAAAIIMMTKVTALELLEDRITVNCISPSLMDTPLSRSFYSIEEFEMTKKNSINKRLCNFKDVINAIVFLCAEENSFITGENLNINGGSILK